MKPKIFKIDPKKIDYDLLKQAAEYINIRGLVAFPTETVYGLGANALDPKAAAGIFEAKKRPLDDPLIVHISKKEDLGKLVTDIPEKAKKLIDRFWPGPLTIVLKKTDIVPEIVTTGLDTVAVRMPSNEIAREFITACGVPIAAPSANLFGRPSPTSPQHVVNDLDGRIDVVLDGGKTDIGVESTVVEFVGDKIFVLRPGGITIEDLTNYIGEVEVVADLSHSGKTPGTYPQHYSPKAIVEVVENDLYQQEKVLSRAQEEKASGKKVGILSKQEHAEDYKDFNTKVLGPEDDSKICASRLFHLLREFDDEKIDIIIAEGIREKGLGQAIMNRLRKAAGPCF